MTSFLPEAASGGEPDGPYPAQLERALIHEDRIQRWEVRAAQWRAHELAERIFGPVLGMKLLGLRRTGPLRGLLRLDVRFDDLDAHLEREARFLAAARRDPVLTRVPLVYVVGPSGD